MVPSTDCSSRGLGLASQHPHGSSQLTHSSQPSVTPVPENALFWPQWYTGKHASNVRAKVKPASPTCPRKGSFLECWRLLFIGNNKPRVFGPLNSFFFFDSTAPDMLDYM